MSAGAGKLYSIARARTIEATMASFSVNGTVHRLAIKPYDVLLDVLRERLNLTGTRRGCDMGTCGCCTVILDGRPVLSCLMLALEADGSEILTIEGVAAREEGGELHPVQEAFVQTGGSQCGFCTPGFIMSAVHLLEKNVNPTEEEIREAISGNMCRCTGYIAIIEAVKLAARTMREREASAGGRRTAATGGGE